MWSSCEGPTPDLPSRMERASKETSKSYFCQRQSKNSALGKTHRLTLPDHFTEADVQKVKDAALRKMAVAFKNHRNREWDKYVKGGRKTPVFEGTLENQSAHWDDFVKFKDSELAKERSRINKKNAEKRISSICWGQVATRWQCLSGISLNNRWWMQGSPQLH